MKHSVILVGGEKGGTGKSTIATNLAIMSAMTGRQTHLIDCDKQETSLKLANRRANGDFEPSLICTRLSGNKLQIPISDLAEKYDVVVIDCGGQDSVELRSAMITPCIDLMLIPIQSGYFDVETLVNMDELVGTSHIYNPNLMAKCVINRAPTHKQVTVAQEAARFIQEDLEHLGLMDTLIYDRVSYSYAVAQGQCAVEYETAHRRDGKASAEMHQLFKEVLGEVFNPIVHTIPLKEVAHG